MTRPAVRVAAIPRGLPARMDALSPRQQELVQDAGLALALATVNVVSLLPYREQLHPLWLALVLVVAQALPLAARRAGPVGTGLVVGGARVAYDVLGFGFAPFPLGPAIAFYTIIDRRGPAWRWLICLVLVAGLIVSQAAPGHSEPYDAIFQVLIFLAAWMAGTLSRTKRASLLAAQHRAERAEAELDAQAVRAAAAERTRIARELHDVVAHHVSLIAVQAEAASSVLPEPAGQAGESVQIIGDTARQALTELRRLLGVLRGPAERPDTAPSASLADLGALIGQVRGTGLHVDLEVAGTPYALAPSIDLTAFRIVQEALTNTLRHTEAKSAAVTLCYEPGAISVQITDGWPRLASEPPRAGLPGAGLGLAGIAERVASCGGSLSVGPTPDGRFSVAARLPAL